MFSKFSILSSKKAANIYSAQIFFEAAEDKDLKLLADM